jgi:hypothetical protein
MYTQIKQQQKVDGWIIRKPNEKLGEMFYRYILGWYSDSSFRVGDILSIHIDNIPTKFKVIRITEECNHTTDSLISDNVMYIPHVIVIRE